MASAMPMFIYAPSRECSCSASPTSHILSLPYTSATNLALDDVLLTEENLEAYMHNLHSHKVYFIGFFCELSIMREREILRGEIDL